MVDKVELDFEVVQDAKNAHSRSTMQGFLQQSNTSKDTPDYSLGSLDLKLKAIK